MATLRQDVWLATQPRRRALRLGPHDGGRARLLVHPSNGQTLEVEPLAGFLEGLAEFLEVVACEPGPAGGEEQHPAAVLEVLARQWGRELPLGVVGIGASVTPALRAATHPSVRAVVAVAPPATLLTAQAPADEAAQGEKALLVLATRERLADLDAATSRFPQASMIVAPGDVQALLAPPWPNAIAGWALWALDSAARKHG